MLDGKFICSNSWLNPIAKVAENLTSTFPEMTPKLRDSYSNFLSSLDEYLGRQDIKDFITIAIPYIVKIALYLNAELTDALVGKMLKLNSNFKNFAYDKFLIDKNDRNKEMEQVNFSATHFKHLHFN